jgi:radical SAM superfamily enzyme YgiQ (UPF0313 family)
MKIILSHGYFLEEDKAEQQIMMPYPPQGILHLNAYLAKYSIPSSVFDSTFSSFIEMSSHIKSEKPDILGLYCNLMTRTNIIKLIEFIRDDTNLRNIKIILGGPDVRHHRREYLSAGADICVVGEGEETLRELIDGAMEQWSDGTSVKGVAYKNNLGEIISTPERTLIKDLDHLPFPDLNQVRVERYFDTWQEHHGYTSLTISTMRGCPYTCQWCSKAVFGNTYRRRSPAPVVKELARLNKTYHPNQYWIVDDVFTISKKWLHEFQQELERQQVSISYSCITRADCMDDEVIRLLVDSGCHKLWIGAESGSQKVLDRMDRRVEAEKVREMIIKSKEAGIETGTFLMLGYPGETLEDIRQTMRHIRLCKPDLMTLTLAYPIMGTSFYKEVETSLKLSDTGGAYRLPKEAPWGSYTDHQLDYPRTYTKSFYKHAIRYLFHGHAAIKISDNNKIPNLLKLIKHRLISIISFTIMKTFRKNDRS